MPFTHLCNVDFIFLTLWISPFLVFSVSGQFLTLSYILEISELNANSVDPNQTPHNTSRSVASDLGLTVCKCPFYETYNLILMLLKFQIYIFGRSRVKITIKHSTARKNS